MKNSVSFFAYFLTVIHGPNREKLAKTLIVQILYAAAFAMVFGLLNNFNIIVFLMGFMAFFASIPQEWTRRAKPNLAALVPLSQKRRTVYNLLSIPAMFVFSVILSGTIVVSVWLLSGLGAAAITGDTAIILSVFRLYTEGLNNAFNDVYAVLLFISMLVFVLGAGIVYSHTSRKKYRNITAIALFTVALVGSEILLQTALKYSGDSSVIHIAGYAGMYIKYTPLPWLTVLLCSAASLAVLGFGLYLVVKKNRPKHY